MLLDNISFSVKCQTKRRKHTEDGSGSFHFQVSNSSQIDSHQNVKIKTKSSLFNKNPYLLSLRLKCLTNNESLRFKFIFVTERIESRNRPPSPIIKTNWSERQNSRYLDSKVMLAIFFLKQYLCVRHFK